MGREGEGGGGGEYEGECLFHDIDDNNEYGNDKEYDNKEDEKRSRRVADDGGESNKDGCDVICGPSFGGVGWRMSIIGPHAAAAVINNDNVYNNCRCGRGPSCPPTSGLSRPAGCRSLLSMLQTVVNGGGTRAFRAL